MIGGKIMTVPDSTLTRLRAALRQADAQAKVSTDKTTLRKLRDYSQGDQFGPRMEYWRGREPIDRDKWQTIRKLASRNDQISPAIGRVVSGILGRDPEWTLRLGENPVTTAVLDDNQEATPEERELALWLQELEQAGTTWHKDANVFQALREALQAAQWAGSSSLRVYIPAEYAEEALAGSQASLEDALELIHVQAVDALSAGPVKDGHGRTIAHWYGYTLADDDGRRIPHVELHTPEWIQHYRVEVTNLIPVGEPVPNPLFDPRKRRRPNYLMHTLEREGGTAITESVIDAQDGLNVELTNMRRNSDMAGFRSIVTFNAESPVDEDGEPAAWTIGPDVVVELRGVPTGVDGATGEGTGITTPSAMVIEPVDPGVFLKAIDSWKAQVIEAFDQSHILAQFNAVSGESKRQSRDDFDKRLVKESAMVAQAIAWVIPTVLRFAAYLTTDRDAEALLDLTADPKLYLDVSQGNLTLFRELAGVYALGLVSRETVVEANPAVSDAQAELKRLDAEAEARAQAPPPREEVEGES